MYAMTYQRTHNRRLAKQHVPVKGTRPVGLLKGHEDMATVVTTLLRMVAATDKELERHMQRVAHHAHELGKTLRLTEHDVEALWYGALLHDIGKLGIDSTILGKPGPLTQEEYGIVQQHTIIGCNLVQQLSIARIVSPVIRYHHERWDGMGYPNGLSGEQIPLNARIVAVVDSFDAMTNQRPYNIPLSEEHALCRLLAGAGSQWDSVVVDAFIDYYERQRVQRAAERAVGAALVYW